MTLVELSMVVALLGVVVASILGVLYSAQTNLNREISRSNSNDQIRLAAQELDREIRSGNVLYDPSTENYPTGDVYPGMSLRVYTQTNYPTRGDERCVQWRITSTGDLQQRSWDPNWQSSPSTLVYPWRIVASNLTNRTDNVAAFVRPAGTLNVVNITLRANDDPTGKKGSTVQIKEAITARDQLSNTQLAMTCGPAAPDPNNPATPPSEPVPPY
jgi:type II secretory pathway pseudopilin PulG